MGYLLLLITSLMWSFVGVMVKSASSMVGSSVITLCRFLFGFVFLGIFLLIKEKRINFVWRDKWIWMGVLGKSSNYICENIAITMGVAYGNVIVGPVQAIFLAFVAVLFFKEEMDSAKLVAVILCITGVLLVSWKGMPLKELFGSSLIPTVLFILSAIGSGFHAISQKKLITYMDSGNMNFSVFFLSSVLTAFPVPLTFEFKGNVHLLAIGSLIGLGIVTGASFYIYAEALKKVSFLVATVVSNASIVFTILWAWLFFHETINAYVITGVVILLIGLIIINIPRGKLIGRLAGKPVQQRNLSMPES